MKNLLIIGAGAFGREVRDLAAGIEAAMGDKCPWRLAGFLDDRSDIYQPGLPVLGAPDTYEPLCDDVFVCAIGDPA
ncbi:MAG: acetyltransferase, partial [Terrimicrobiaceae bacterium]